MKDAIRLGVGPLLVPVPGPFWRRGVASQARRFQGTFARLSTDHRRVRAFAVAELPRRGRPVEPEHVARELDLPLERVQRILAELEERLLFLFRAGGGAVEWAYPVTAAATPHRLRFDGGEEIFAA